MKDWNITCPHCKRRSLIVYPTGVAYCPRCGRSSSKFLRFIENRFRILWVVNAAAALLLVAIFIRMST